MDEHARQHSLLPVMQSAYRPFHSTETALVKLASDCLMNMDKQELTLLVVIDLSAAFDTVDHKILLSQLKERFGVGGLVHEWFVSYLSCRKQAVCIESVVSSVRDVPYGVPQGSCCGPY